MKILLLGEYSNVHWTLSEGLRRLGHQVTVLSNGDFWKDYPRDIDLQRSYSKWGGISYMLKLYSLLPRLRGYDVVQLINPMFLEIKAERIMPVYEYLKRHNGKVILGAFGMDFYWADVCCKEKPLRYSDFNIGQNLRTNADALKERTDWIGTAKEHLNRVIAEEASTIVAGLYEYYACYRLRYPGKTVFIPYPIVPKKQEPLNRHDGKLRLFIGINRSRSAFKGTDIMLPAAQEVAARHPDKVELKIACNIPFKQYYKMMADSDALLDQLYSYTPSMNALEAMSRGIICIGGGEPESYDILHEDRLRPIINVEPNYKSVVDALEGLVAHIDGLPELKSQSMEYIRKHHDYIKVAEKYEQIYYGNTKSI